MLVIERSNTNLVQGHEVYPSIAPRHNAEVHQQADEISEAPHYCCLTWIINTISSVFNAILTWLGYVDSRIELFYDELPGSLKQKQNTLQELGGLKTCPNVKSIRLGKVPYSDYGLAELLEKCPNAESVSFLSCESAGERVNEALTKLPHLRELMAPPNMSDRTFSQICNTAPLTHLDMSWCESLTDRGLVDLSHLTQLTYFKALHTNISDAHFAVVSKLPVKVLDLTHCHSITEKGWETIIPTLKDVQELIVADNSLTDKILFAIAKLPLTKLSVRRIDFFNQKNKVTEVGYIALASSETLTKLDVSDNFTMSAAVLDAYTRMPHLQELDIRTCRKIDNQVIKAFIQKRSDVRVQASLR